MTGCEGYILCCLMFALVYSHSISLRTTTRESHIFEAHTEHTTAG